MRKWPIKCIGGREFVVHADEQPEALRKLLEAVPDVSPFLVLTYVESPGSVSVFDNRKAPGA